MASLQSQVNMQQHIIHTHNKDKKLYRQQINNLKNIVESHESQLCKHAWIIPKYFSNMNARKYTIKYTFRNILRRKIDVIMLFLALSLSFSLSFSLIF